MTIIEIKEKLDGMSAGSQSHFHKYMVELGMFKNEDQAYNTMHQYLRHKPNAATFIKRQQISYAFEEWRYKYGDGIRGKSTKEDVIEKYNDKLQKYWRENEQTR